MKYRELKITAGRELLELAEAELVSNGFTSMMIDDPMDALDILDHPDIYRYDYIDESIAGDITRLPSITIYFTDDEEGLEQMQKAISIAEAVERDHLAGNGNGTHPDAGIDVGGCGRMIRIDEITSGDDSEWLYKWQEHFKPSRVGERIVVKPSWEEYVPDDRDLIIEMDPGMAFGSGLHETTSMCIKALERAIPDKKSGLKVLDVGCGTGILAIAAALLGADDCLGIDIDPDAVRVAEENIERNGLSGMIRARYGDLTEGVDYKADIIAANLMADLVIRLSPSAREHLEEEGLYITSGILDIKEETVSEAIREAGFDIIEIMKDGEWRAIIARKN